MTINKAIALRIVNLMNQYKMSQYELSKKSTIEQSTISHILNEDTKLIRIQTILKISMAFDMSITDFFNNELFDKTKIEIY